MPIGYSVVLENGAPTASRPGAANTPSTSPTSPLAVLSPTFRATSATAPSTAGATRASNGPWLRIRVRIPARAFDHVVGHG